MTQSGEIRQQQKRRQSAVAVAVLSLLFALPASALVIGDFEGGFDGWGVSGATSTQTSVFGISPTLGNAMLELSTKNAVSDSVLETFLSLGSGTLDALSPTGNDVVMGSATVLILTANAGDELSFDYNFLTREDATRAPDYQDFFFSTIRGGDGSEEGEVVREDVEAMSRLATSHPKWDQTGWQNVSYTFNSSGTFTIGFGVVDVLDDKVESRLLLDQIKHIPEPSTGLLLSLGLVGLAIRRRHGR